jgi:FkbM family methyltransferase
MMDLYKNQTKVTDTLVDGVGPWIWPTADRGDSGGWVAGDWTGNHRDNILQIFSNRDKRVVVQAGGSCGLYPRFLSDIFQTVYTFEPDRLNFFCLVNNCQKNNIIAMNAALGSQHSMVSVNCSDTGNVGAHTVSEKEESIVPTLLIDDLNLSHCDFIWLDVEGYEDHVIEGAFKTLIKFKPVLMLETLNEKSNTLLTGMGYTFLKKSGSDSILLPPQ